MPIRRPPIDTALRVILKRLNGPPASGCPVTRRMGRAEVAGAIVPVIQIPLVTQHDRPAATSAGHTAGRDLQRNRLPQLLMPTPIPGRTGRPHQRPRTFTTHRRAEPMLTRLRVKSPAAHRAATLTHPKPRNPTRRPQMTHKAALEAETSRPPPRNRSGGVLGRVAGSSNVLSR